MSQAKELNQGFLNKLRMMGIVEGTSTLVLFFIAMPLKYLAGFPLAVKIAGPVHGFLFLALVLMFFIATFKVPIRIWWSLLGVLSAIFPFGPFVMDIYLKSLSQK